MGRSTKQGIDYFSLDCALDDKTEMYIIETGAAGYGVLVTLWQMIYANNGYYIKADDDLLLLTKKRVDADINDINAYIKTALKRDIFDQELYDRHQILTSRALQKRYFDAAKRKKTVRVIQDFLLIDVYAHINKINVDIKSIDVGINATKEKEKEKEKEYKTFTSENDSDGGCDENPPDDSPPEKPKPSKFKFSVEHYQLAVELSCPSKARFGNALKINLDEWADAIRKLNEIDGHSLLDIASLWRWIVNDDTQRGSFTGWAFNCRTPMKLRQRKDGLMYFDVIANQRQREVNPHAGNQSQPGAGSHRPAGRESLVDQQRSATKRWLAERQGGPDSPEEGRVIDGKVVGFDD